MCMTFRTRPVSICEGKVLILMSTDTTAFCRWRPPMDLQNRANTLMRLVLEFPQKLTEPKIGDLFAPKPFHTFKVQVFKEQNIELPTEFYR